MEGTGGMALERDEGEQARGRVWFEIAAASGEELFFDNRVCKSLAVDHGVRS